jgi:hypothetical protein
MRCVGAAFVAVVALAGSAALLEAQGVDDARCYVLELAAPDVVFMLDRDLQGDTLILTTEPLEGPLARGNRTRAYFGIESWRQKEPLRPASWAWSVTDADTIRIGFVLPLAGIVWTATETDTGLAGTVSYTSDDVSEPRRTAPFQAHHVECTPHPK